MKLEKLESEKVIIKLRKQQAKVMVNICKDPGKRKRNTKELVELWLALERTCDHIKTVKCMGIGRLKDCQEWLNLWVKEK